MKMLTMLMLVLLSACAALHNAAATDYKATYDRLLTLESHDPYIRTALTSAKRDLRDLQGSMHLPEARIIVATLPRHLRPELGVFYTNACASLTLPGLVPLVVCNESYIHEIEAAVRANEQPERYRVPHLDNDPALFRFVRRIAADPTSYARAMRPAVSRDAAPDKFEQHIIHHLKLALLFFVGHELGHVDNSRPRASLARDFSPEQPTDVQVPVAVVRMCRHAEEFWKEGNGLAGYEWTRDVDSEARKIERGYLEVQSNLKNAEEWYADETNADRYATRLLVGHLDRLSKIGFNQSIEDQYFVIETLFMIGVYSWYRDLNLLAMGICGKTISHTSELSLCMAMSRLQYIYASSIFSDVHRPILLRTRSAILDILEKRADASGLPKEDRAIAITIDELRALRDAGNERKAMYKLWYSQSWQRAILQDILIDAPVKLAMHTCATGWFLEVDRRRGTPQMFLMQFEGMKQARERLQNLLQGRTQ